MRPAFYVSQPSAACCFFFFMTSLFSTSLFRVLPLCAALLVTQAGWAQTSPALVKVKSKASRADGTATQKTKVKAADPQPVSPAASAPQLVGAAPASAATPGAASNAWLADLEAAKAQAKATNRPLVAVFSGSDWCKPCIIYEQEVFAQPAFAEFAKNRLVLAHFDFPRQKKNQPTAAQLKLNEAAAAQLNREGDFPLAVILSPEGKVLAKTGYIPGGPEAFQRYLKQLIPTL